MLPDHGFRYLLRPDGSYGWRHPTDIRPGDLDASDMTDEEFDAAVREWMAKINTPKSVDTA